jgi:hypothetical protein
MSATTTNLTYTTLFGDMLNGFTGTSTPIILTEVSGEYDHFVYTGSP